MSFIFYNKVRVGAIGNFSNGVLNVTNSSTSNHLVLEPEKIGTKHPLSDSNLDDQQNGKKICIDNVKDSKNNETNKNVEDYKNEKEEKKKQENEEQVENVEEVENVENVEEVDREEEDEPDLQLIENQNKLKGSCYFWHNANLTKELKMFIHDLNFSFDYNYIMFVPHSCEMLSHNDMNHLFKQKFDWRFTTKGLWVAIE